MSQSTGDTPISRAERLSTVLINRLVREGAIRDHHWRDALAAYPRHHFVRSLYEPTESGAAVWSKLSSDSPGFLPAIHSGRGLVTGLSPLSLWGQQVPVSVSPPTDLLVWSLQALDVFDGAEILELGTGTGHGTAVLTHRVGPSRVTSVDIDPEQHRHAADNLGALNLRPTLLLGDSAAFGARVENGGEADERRYDRILVAHDMPTVPPRWAELLRADGGLLMRVTGGLGAGGHVVLRHPLGTMSALSGPFLPWTAPLSPYRAPGYLPTEPTPDLRDPEPPESGWPARSGDTPHPPDVLTTRGVPALLAQLLLPPGTRAWDRASATTPTEQAWATYLRAPDGSWAEISHTLDHRGRYSTRWAGPTDLLHLIAVAHEIYRDLGSPPVTAFGVSADHHGAVVWHSDPRTGPRWPLPNPGPALHSITAPCEAGGPLWR